MSKLSALFSDPTLTYEGSRLRIQGQASRLGSPDAEFLSTQDWQGKARSPLRKAEVSRIKTQAEERRSGPDSRRAWRMIESPVNG